MVRGEAGRPGEHRFNDPKRRRPMKTKTDQTAQTTRRQDHSRRAVKYRYGPATGVRRKMGAMLPP